MKFKLLPTRETLEYGMKVDRYWYYANQFKELCRFIDDFNIKAFCTDNLSLMKSGTFCRILQRGTSQITRMIIIQLCSELFMPMLISVIITHGGRLRVIKFYFQPCRTRAKRRV